MENVKLTKAQKEALASIGPDWQVCPGHISSITLKRLWALGLLKYRENPDSGSYNTGLDGVSYQWRRVIPEVTTPGGVTLCPSVVALAEDMQYKLDKNERKPCPEMIQSGQDKRTWTHCTFSWLLGRLWDELEELKDELAAGDLREAQLECADIANFAMMVHDNLKRRLETQN